MAVGEEECLLAGRGALHARCPSWNSQSSSRSGQERPGPAVLVTPGVADAGGKGCDSLSVSASLGFSMGAAMGKVTRTLGSRGGNEEQS